MAVHGDADGGSLDFGDLVHRIPQLGPSFRGGPDCVRDQDEVGSRRGALGVVGFGDRLPFR
ncbi:MAG: hypothetical protein PVSMB10_01130 [Pseudarthrobacter sp.]